MTPREDAATTYALILLGAWALVGIGYAIRHGVNLLRDAWGRDWACGNPSCALCNAHPRGDQ